MRDEEREQGEGGQAKAKKEEVSIRLRKEGKSLSDVRPTRPSESKRDATSEHRHECRSSSRPCESSMGSENSGRRSLEDVQGLPPLTRLLLFPGLNRQSLHLRPSPNGKRGRTKGGLSRCSDAYETPRW